MGLIVAIAITHKIVHHSQIVLIACKLMEWLNAQIALTLIFQSITGHFVSIVKLYFQVAKAAILT